MASTEKCSLRMRILHRHPGQILTTGGLQTHFVTGGNKKKNKNLYIYFHPAYNFIYLSCAASFLSIKAYQQTSDGLSASVQFNKVMDLR